MPKYNDHIIDILKDKEISLLGFADLSEVDSHQRQELPYGICFAIALNVFPCTTETPTAAYYDEYRNINRKLKKVGLFLEEKIQEQGYHAYSLMRNPQNEDLRTILPFKTLATRSGLGWIGRSSILITREYGSAIRLNGVITDMPFETAEPINRSYCGNCRECVDKCPAQAIVGNNWDLSMDRNDLVDPFACKNKVIERGKELGITVGSCGICVAVCPWTRKYMKEISYDL